MNKFIEKLFDIAGWMPKEKGIGPNVSSTSSVNPFTVWAQTKKVPAAKALEVYTGWVYAAVRAIAVEIGSMEHRLFRIGKEKDVEIFEHELLDLLGGVNDYQTGLELKYVTAAHLQTVGNAYWYLEGVKSATDKPLAIHVMNPAKIRVLVNREEFPTRIQGYEYRLGSRIYKYQPFEVVHFKDPDPNDPFEGLGTVQAEAQWIDADNYAMEFNRRFFLNGARIGGFLESEAAYTPEQLQYLKLAFEAAFKGVDNAYKVMALPKGTKYTEGGKTQKEMDFPQLSLIMRDRIIAAFRVPRTALGITDDVNRANAEATDYVFAARTIRPIMRLITTYLNEFVVPRYGDDIYLDFKDPVPEDRAKQIDEMNKSLGSNGATPTVTINEAREKYFGMPPIEGGDDLYIPLNLTKIGTTPPQRTGSPTGASIGATRARTRFAMNAKRRQTVTKEMGERAAKDIADMFRDAVEVKKKIAEDAKSITELSDDEYEKIYKVFALRVDQYEKKQKAAVLEFNDKQRKEVLANLENAVKSGVITETKAVKKSALFDKEKGISLLIDLSAPILTELAKKEGSEAALLIGIPNMDILTPPVQEALDKGIALMSESYNETTLNLLAEKLKQGLQEGLSQKELADLVNGVYDYSDEVRALQVARTETFRVANYSTQEAWRQSGVVHAQKWYTAADDRVCPYCEEMNGTVVSIDDDFFKIGDEITGTDGSKIVVDYSDIGAPPLHTTCRCYLRPEDISLE